MPGLSPRQRACACLSVAIVHGIVLLALIHHVAVMPPVVPRALRLIALSPAKADSTLRPLIQLPPPRTPAISPPAILPLEVQAAPAVPRAQSVAATSPPALAPVQAERPGTYAQTTRPITAQSPAQSSPGAESRTWQDRLEAWLQAHRVYPEAARLAREEGSPSIQFTIAKDGHVTAVSLVRTSGFEQLDAAALALLAHAWVPPPPPRFPDNLSVTISIRYALSR